MEQMRIDKFLCDRTGCTRKEAKKLIKNGQVCVNNEKVTKPEVKICLSKDKVFVNQKEVTGESMVYIMLYKPKGVVSATKDNFDQTVVDLVRPMTHKDVFPVGRLDKDTTGLLLLTNDGELSHELLSPRKHVDKRYEALVQGKITKKEQEVFQKGMDIGEKHLTQPANLEVLEVKEEVSKVIVTIREGKFHQIKRMFHAVGSEVLTLKRLSMGNLDLDENLLEGEARFLTEDEVKRIKGVIC